MESLWKLDLLLFFSGITLEVAVVLILLSLTRSESIVWLSRSMMILLLSAIALQLIGLLVPDVPIASYWFILGAFPLLLPASLLYWIQQNRSAVAPQGQRAAPPADLPKIRAEPPTSSAQTEFQEHLKKIPELLAAHPHGLTLVEIGQKLGLEWRRLTGATNELLKRGRIQKQGKRYFIPSGK